MKHNVSKRMSRKGMEIFAGLSLALLLTGCFKPQARPMDPLTAVNNATFYAEKIEGSAREATFIEGFSIPKARLYSFTVCIRDKRTQDSIKGHKFEISGGESDAALAQTDASGCLSWSENVEFSFLADEAYLVQSRMITAKGMHSGTREVQFAINPWNRSGRSAEVIDLARQSVPESMRLTGADSRARLEGLDVMGTRFTRPMWITRSDLRSDAWSSSKNKIVQRKLTLRMTPAISVRGLQSRPYVYELEQARIEARAVLLAVANVAGQERVYEIWSTPEAVPFIIDDGAFKVEFGADLPVGNPGMKYRLALRVSPVSGPSGLMPFEGLFEIGTYDQLLDTAKLPFELKSSNIDGRFQFDEARTKFLSLPAPDVAQPATSSGTKDPKQGSPSSSTATANTRPAGTGATLPEKVIGNLPSGVTASSVFEVSPIRPVYEGIAAGETPTRRTVYYTATVCIVNTLNGRKRAVGVEFVVITADGRRIKPMQLTDPGQEGCISWPDRVSHNYYDTERFLLVPVKIRNEESGFEESRTLALNPWDRFFFGRDFKNNETLVNEINSKPRAASRLLAHRFGFDTVEHREFEVDEFLNIRQIKRINLNVPMRVQRHSSFIDGGNRPAEPLRDGLYLLKSALYFETIDPTGQKVEIIVPMRGERSLVPVRGGDLLATIDFSIPEQRLMRARGNLVIELYPLDGDRVGPLVSSGKLNVGARDRSLETLIVKDSGLVLPTFAAPLFIKEEGGGSTFFPTTDLQGGRVGTDANDSELSPNSLMDLLTDSKNDQMTSPSEQSLRPLLNATINSLYSKASAAVTAYKFRMREAMSLASLLQVYNLEYVSLGDEAAAFAREPKLRSNNLAFPSTGAVEPLLSFMNVEFPKTGGIAGPPTEYFQKKQQVTRDSLVEFVEGKRQLDAQMAGRLCILMMKNMMNRMAPGGSLMKKPIFDSTLSNRCLNEMGIHLSYEDPEKAIPEFFVVDRKVRVLELESRLPKFGEARQMGFSVGADVSFGRNNSSSTSWSVGWSPLSMIEGLFGKVGKSAAGAAAVGGGMSLFSSGWGAMGVSVSVSKSWSKSASFGEGSSFGGGHLILLEQNDLAIKVKRFERCAAIRVNPQFWGNGAWFKRHLNPNVKFEELHRILTRGIFLCTGKEEARTLELPERYYTFMSPSLEGIQQDGGDLRNQPWFLSLRGVRDFAMLMKFLEARKASTSEIPRNLQVGELALERLETAYKLYQGHTNAMPGIYSIESKFEH